MSTRRWRALAAGTVGLLALVSVQAGVGAQADRRRPVVEAARQVTTSPDPVRLFPTPGIAVSPNDPLTAVVAVGDARNGGCALRVTRDGGLSWSTTAANLLPDGYQHCIQRNFGPYITPAFASDGTLYVGFSGSKADNHPNGPITAFVARSNDLGRNHRTFMVAEPAPYEYTPEGKPAEQGFEQHRFNSLAVDPTNPRRIYTGWRKSIGGVSAPFGSIPVMSMVATSDDGGRTWSKPADLTATLADKDVFGSDIPMLVVDRDGTAYAFTKERPKRPPEGQPPADSRLFMFRSTDGGATWKGSVIYDGVPFITNPAAAVDPKTGALYVTYEARGQDRTHPAEVYFLRSSDNGATWSEPKRITDDPPEQGYNQYFPGISVAPNGRIDIAWHDFRNDPFFTPGVAGPMGTTEGERWWDVYYAYSTDGGRTWSENIRVTDRSIDADVGVTFNNQDIIGPIGVASTDTSALFTWGDSRAGGKFDAEDAYFTRVSFEAAARSATTLSDNRALWSVIGAGAALAVGGLVLLLGSRAGRRRAEGAAEGVPTTR